MHFVRLSNSIIIGHKSWQDEVQKRNFSEDKAIEFIGEIGDNLSELQAGIDFWRDVLPSLKKPLGSIKNINKDSNTTREWKVLAWR
jgi:hypothetical protein